MFGYLRLAIAGGMVIVCLLAWLFFSRWQDEKQRAADLGSALAHTQLVLLTTKSVLNERDDEIVKLQKEFEHEQAIVNAVAHDKCFDSVAPDAVLNILR